MIDIKLIRENPELVKENIKKKFQNEKLKLVDKLKKLDEDWRKIKFQEDKLRAERNKISEEVNKAKKAKDEEKAKKLILEAKKIPPKIENLEEKRKKLETEIEKLQSDIPNIISENVPIGEDASKNVVDEVIGKPRQFDFKPKNHIEISESLGMADFESSARVAGTGFYYIEDKLAILNAALINFARDLMVSKGFRYVETPLMLRGDVMNKVTDLHDQENMIYKIEKEDLYLIGTSEHSLIGRYAGKEIPEKILPLKQTSYSMCFRKEIGSHGIEEKGLFRTHQFNKVEMIVICKPEDSGKFFNELKNISIEIFKKLEIPIRVLRICSGDLGDLKHEQVDIEAYSPIKDDYYEVGSCSNLTDAQARKLKISTRIKGERVIPHTLNNTAIATSRALITILENHQQKDGSIKIPKALWNYTGFKTISKKD